MLPRRFKETRAEFIVSVAVKRKDRERERERERGEPGRLFVYPRVTVGSIDKTIVFRGTDRDLARSLAEIPSFVIYIRYVGVGWS
ncbi:hypothetical protein ALC62_05300 [Cyphomyrmex costatus]|uniref:Uncharacterized protein n=1 Tax=Cyphomyrmex costatus TaxID=456900 RepID=A0A195CSV9_9HYME|nr:hypothetical protein ALC62_05300 [Cyphomyrmex costatus]